MFYFIVNKHGGSGIAALTWDLIEDWLKKNLKLDVDYKIFESENRGHATELAEKISNIDEIQDSDKKIVIVGGDGTINEVLNGIKNFDKIKFGIIPTGSANDFARGLDIKKNEPIKNLEKIVNSNNVSRAVDLGFARFEDDYSRYFAISSGVGMDALVCKKANTTKVKPVLNKFHLGRFAYIILTISSLFSMKCRDVQIKFDEEEPVVYKNLIFCAAMNTCAEGGGVKMAPDAKYDDGELSALFVRNIPKFLAFLLFPFLILGKHTKFKGFKIKNFKKMELVSNEPLVSHTDGEWSGDVKKVSMECLKQKLKLLN